MVCGGTPGACRVPAGGLRTCTVRGAGTTIPPTVADVQRDRRPGPRAGALGALGGAAGGLCRRLGFDGRRRGSHCADPRRQGARRGRAARRAGIATVLGGAFGAGAGGARGRPRSSRSRRRPGLDVLRMSLRRVIEPDAGDVDISCGRDSRLRGSRDRVQDNLEIVEELADALRRAAVGIPTRGGRGMAAQDPPGRPIGPEGEAPGVPGLRHLGSSRAPRGNAGSPS